MVLHSLHNLFHNPARYIPQDFQQVAARWDLTAETAVERAIETRGPLG
jgi:hypothetical protein